MEKKKRNLSMWTTPEKKEVNLTYNQFCNLLAFNVILSNSKYILELDPDYLIEKYERYIGDPEQIVDKDEWKYGGIHEVLRKEIIEPYFEKWKHSLRKMKIYSALKED